MISYAQNREDVLLNRLFPADHKGFYIDVGANHPILGSVTAHFYARGWRGINVEPSCSYGQVAQARTGDVNLQIALSNQTGTATFYEFPDATGMSTLGPEAAAIGSDKLGYQCVPRTVPVTTLAQVCREHAPASIDFISIDVEGHERQVLEGADFARYRPRVVVIEATQPHTTRESHEQWEAVLLSADYLFAFFDGLNRFYVRQEDAGLVPRLAVPANVFDDFVTYSEHCNMVQLQNLQLRLDTLEQIGPVSAAVARRINHFERRLPGLSNMLLQVRQRLAVKR